MTVLVSYLEDEPGRVETSTRGAHEITRQLAAYGVHFAQWAHAADPSDDESTILRAYARELEELKRTRGYESQDVVRMQRDSRDPEWSLKARTARQKFLEEHAHAEDEVRFFVAGSGLFSLRLGGRVLQVLCERGDLLSVPAGTRHWFDMGSEPYFCAVRLFGSPSGWVANFTGDPIARQFPSFDEVAARWR